MDFKIMYGSGSVEGGVGRDDLHVGGLTLPQAQFGEVDAEKGDAFKGAKFAGIAGLAFPSLSKGGVLPIFDQMMAKRVMHRNRFGFYLQEKRDGALWIDDIPKDAYQGELIQHKVVTPPAYWSLKLIDIKVNGKALNVCPGGCKVAVDSGTSLLTGPSEGTSKVLKALQVQTDCSNREQLGQLTYVLEGTDSAGKTIHHEYPMDPKEYLLESPGQCHPGLSNLDVPKPNGPVWILGDMFMMRYFSVFDRDTMSVYLARANPKAVEKKSTMVRLPQMKLREAPRAQNPDEWIGDANEDAWEEA
jgi:hypothetical protein